MQKLFNLLILPCIFGVATRGKNRYFKPALQESSYIRPINDPKLYDYIVVGGGAAGCPLSRTLAEAGKDVLLIERGGPRKDNHKTLDIYGTGIVIADEEVSQPVITLQGVRSHIGNVLSGGTAINMAIVIEEDKEYFDYLRKTFSGVKFDMEAMNAAFDWTTSRVANPMPSSTPYGQAWRTGLQNTLKLPNVGYSHKINVNRSWEGSSLFNSSNGWYRYAADVLLGVYGADMPLKLDILLRTTVLKVEFDDSGDVPKAICVLYRGTTKGDYAPIISRPKPMLGSHVNDMHTWFGKIMDPAAEVSEKLFKERTVTRVCVKEGGEIILSAGAILSPLLLYHSGIGPKSEVEKARAKLVHEDSMIGQNVSDRVLVPVGLFFKGDLPDSGFPPRICQSIGLDTTGPDCSTYTIGDLSDQCSLTPAEELSGAQIAEGTIYSTRFIFPPEKRDHPLVDYIIKVITDCSVGKLPLDSPLLRPLCKIARPLIDCFRKVAANFYFSAEPHSRGYIKLDKRGRPIINANYMTHKKDLFDAAKGVSNIIKVVNSRVYDNVFEPAGPKSCPAKVLNGIAGLLNALQMNSRDFVSDADLKIMETWVDAMRLPINSYAAPTNKSTMGRNQGNEKRKFPHHASPQLYATYPPILPDPEDIPALQNYVLSWMTSIWHWAGSIPMGDSVNPDFTLKGVDGLSIVDASVLPQVTRMNPFATLLAIGRYAGACKLHGCTYT